MTDNLSSADFDGLEEVARAATEPVAWRYRYHSDGPWQASVALGCHDDGWFAKNYPTFESEPLYGPSLLSAYREREEECERLRANNLTAAESRENAMEAFRRHHRNSCYPDAMDVEAASAVDDIISALGNMQHNDARLEALLRSLVSAFPNDDVADGVTALDVWRKEAAAMLGARPMTRAALAATMKRAIESDPFGDVFSQREQEIIERLASAIARDRTVLDDPTTSADAEIAALRASAEAVLWFDWSDNDSDAVAAIERLRRASSLISKKAGENG